MQMLTYIIKTKPCLKLTQIVDSVKFTSEVLFYLKSSLLINLNETDKFKFYKAENRTRYLFHFNLELLTKIFYLTVVAFIS